MRCQLISALAFVLIAQTVCRADSLSLGDNHYEGTLNGIKNGKVSITIRDKVLAYDLDQVTEITVDDLPKLVDAEAARNGNPKAAAALYKQLLPTINKQDLKLLVEWRAIDPTDRDARWTEAVALFLDVYQAAPTETVFNGRPSHWPNAASTMLDDSAKRVTAALKESKNDDVKKNLRKYLLDIYTKAGNTAEAQRVAREIETGIAVEPIAIAPQAAPADALTAALSEISAAFMAKNFDAALKLADAQLPAATGETAVQIYSLKAQAFEGQSKLKEAAGAWLRIFAHYPASSAAPTALLNAAHLQKRLNDSPAAKLLLDEIVQKYPNSKEAALAPRE